MTYNEFLKLVHQTFNYFNWRYGQSVMNVLSSVWESKYSEILDTENDCYDDDNIVQKTLNKLEKEWKSHA
jgi:hypothetical protein